MKKVVLITGTSSGLGLESALLFARHGYQVYATMRNLAKAGGLRNKAIESGLKIEILSLDVTVPESVEACIAEVMEKEGRIDLLVNNAGGGFAKTTEQATEEEVKWVTDLNYFGVVRCTKAVIPIMRQQQSGHIINITSVGGLVGQPFNEFYCAAKFAVEGYTESLATYVTPNFGIHFSLVEPGGIQTEFFKSATEKTMQDGQMAHPAYLHILQKYMAGMQQRAAASETRTYQTAAEVAEVVLAVAKNPNPPLRVRSSDWAEDFCRLKTQADPDGRKLVAEIQEKFLK